MCAQIANPMKVVIGSCPTQAIPSGQSDCFVQVFMHSFTHRTPSPSPSHSMSKVQDGAQASMQQRTVRRSLVGGE